MPYLIKLPTRRFHSLCYIVIYMVTFLSKIEMYLYIIAICWLLSKAQKHYVNIHVHILSLKPVSRKSDITMVSN